MGHTNEISFTYVPALKSLATDGLIHKGGTKIRVSKRSFGWANSGFIRSKGTSCKNSINKGT